MDNLNNFNTGINTSPDKFNKKQIVIGVAAILVLLIVGLIVYFNRKNRIEAPPAAPQETAEQRQMRELEALRVESNPLTDEEIKARSAELDKLRKNSKPLSQTEADQQLEELNNLRSQ